MNWNREWNRVRVSVSRKKRNQTGWQVTMGDGSVWFPSKPEAIKEVRAAIRALHFRIEPAKMKGSK